MMDNMKNYLSTLKHTYWRPEAQLEWALFKDSVENWFVSRIRRRVASKKKASSKVPSHRLCDRDFSAAAASPEDMSDVDGIVRVTVPYSEYSWTHPPGNLVSISTIDEAKATLGLRSGGGDDRHQSFRRPLGRLGTSSLQMNLQGCEIYSEIQAMWHDIPSSSEIEESSQHAAKLHRHRHRHLSGPPIDEAVSTQRAASSTTSAIGVRAWKSG